MMIMMMMISLTKNARANNLYIDRVALRITRVYI